jgi:hypothetical protein
MNGNRPWLPDQAGGGQVRHDADPIFERHTVPLLGTELVTNNLRRSGLAIPGRLVTVTVMADGQNVRV